MKRQKQTDPRQGDLFDWAATRPTAAILDFIGPIARRMWAERHQAPVTRAGKVLPMPVHPDERRRA